jgi:hypothetical protein
MASVNLVIVPASHAWKLMLGCELVSILCKSLSDMKRKSESVLDIFSNRLLMVKAGGALMMAVVWVDVFRYGRVDLLLVSRCLSRSVAMGVVVDVFVSLAGGMLVQRGRGVSVTQLTVVLRRWEEHQQRPNLTVV